MTPATIFFIPLLMPALYVLMANGLLITAYRGCRQTALRVVGDGVYSFAVVCRQKVCAQKAPWGLEFMWLRY